MVTDVMLKGKGGKDHFLNASSVHIINLLIDKIEFKSEFSSWDEQTCVDFASEISDGVDKCIDTLYNECYGKYFLGHKTGLRYFLDEVKAFLSECGGFEIEER